MPRHLSSLIIAERNTHAQKNESNLDSLSHHRAPPIDTVRRHNSPVDPRRQRVVRATVRFVGATEHRVFVRRSRCDPRARSHPRYRDHRRRGEERRDRIKAAPLRPPEIYSPRTLSPPADSAPTGPTPQSPTTTTTTIHHHHPPERRSRSRLSSIRFATITPRSDSRRHTYDEEDGSLGFLASRK